MRQKSVSVRTQKRFLREYPGHIASECKRRSYATYTHTNNLEQLHGYKFPTQH